MHVLVYVYAYPIVDEGVMSTISWAPCVCKIDAPFYTTTWSHVDFLVKHVLIATKNIWLGFFNLMGLVAEYTWLWLWAIENRQWGSLQQQMGSYGWTLSIPPKAMSMIKDQRLPCQSVEAIISCPGLTGRRLIGLYDNHVYCPAKYSSNSQL